MFSIFLCKEKNVNLYSAYCHIKLISWCCCNYFVQCTEIQSISENQTTSAEVVLYRIPNMFSAWNHMVYTACMLKGPFPFFQKNHFSSKFIWKEIALVCLLLQGLSLKHKHLFKISIKLLIQTLIHVCTQRLCSNPLASMIIDIINGFTGMLYDIWTWCTKCHNNTKILHSMPEE